MKHIILILLFFGTITLFGSENKIRGTEKEPQYVIISIRTDANEYMRALVEGARMFTSVQSGTNQKTFGLGILIHTGLRIRLQIMSILDL